MNEKTENLSDVFVFEHDRKTNYKSAFHLQVIMTLKTSQNFKRSQTQCPLFLIIKEILWKLMWVCLLFLPST